MHHEQRNQVYHMTPYQEKPSADQEFPVVFLTKESTEERETLNPFVVLCEGIDREEQEIDRE